MEEDSWVLDSLVGFLRGPVWNVPVLTFIEHKSLSEIISIYVQYVERYKNDENQNSPYNY
jgi:hypothetical protein